MTKRDSFKRFIDAETRGEAMPAPARAALAFARWQGLTGEAGLNAQAAKLALDRLIDFTEPEEWLGLTLLTPDLGEPLVRDLMKYALTRGLAETKAHLRALEQTPDWPLKPDNAPTPSPQRPRRRGRGM